jgi:hypothetical protein
LSRELSKRAVRLVSAAGNVRAQHEVGGSEQWMAGRRRFGFEYIEARPGYPTFGQRGLQRGRID